MTKKDEEKIIDGVCFVDFDGVICTDRTYYAYEQDREKNVIRALDPIGIKLIDRICRDYNLHVVLSTSWRNRYDCANILQTHGFRAPFHPDEKTVSVVPNSRWNGYGNERGNQIHEWLYRHPEVKRFVIFDDDCTRIHGTNLDPFHVMTDYYDGVRTKNYLMAKQILDDQKSGSLVFDVNDRHFDYTDEDDNGTE